MLHVRSIARAGVAFWRAALAEMLGRRKLASSPPFPTLPHHPMINYNPHDWRSHLLDIRGSMLPEIMGRVITCVAWGAVVTVAHELLPRYFAGFSLALPSVVHALVGTALGLLLVFRTNASYDRFWEGRKLWGSMVNECRNLARQGSAMLERDVELRCEFILWTASFPYAAMSALRGSRILAPSSKGLPNDQVQQVLVSQHLPLAVASQMTRVLFAARDKQLISDYLLGPVDHNINQLVDYFGACERIHRTPIPFAYMVHLRRALILYCFTLPFALVGDLHWWTIAGTFLIAYVFFGIEEIGVEIEDPFGFDENDLPLERFCQTIENNLLAVLDPAVLTAQTGAPSPENGGDGEA
jgi:ion channel-forming bestrophin family protein